MAQSVVGSWRSPLSCVTGIHQFSFPRLCVLGRLLCRLPAVAPGLTPPSERRNPPAKLGRNGFGYQEPLGRATKDSSSPASAETTWKPPVCCLLGKTFLRMSMHFPCFGKEREEWSMGCAFWKTPELPPQSPAGQNFPCLKEEQSPTLPLGPWSVPVTTAFCSVSLISFPEHGAFHSTPTWASPGNPRTPQSDSFASPFHVQSTNMIPYMTWPTQLASHRDAYSKGSCSPAGMERGPRFPEGWGFTSSALLGS